LKALLAPGFTVLVFVGASQPKISIEVAEAIQLLGPNGRYVRCNGKGPNALDFHIAFYIGEMAASDSATFFHIVSKDTGFDPLVAHLRARGLRVYRCASVADLPMFRAAQAKAASAAANGPKTTPAELQGDARMRFAEAWLLKQGKALPGSEPALHRSLGSAFQKALPDTDIAALIEQLQHRQLITLQNGKLAYQLPAKQV